MTNRAETADHPRTNPSSRLPRKASLADPSVCRLYFLAGAGLVKIGISTNPTSRIRSIRNSSPVPLELLALVEGCSAMEGILHCRFSALRQHGEWFTDDGQIRAYIEAKGWARNLGALSLRGAA